MFRRIISLAILVALDIPLASAESFWTGYGGPEGMRVYPQATPPATFGAADIAQREA